MIHIEVRVDIDRPAAELPLLLVLLPCPSLLLPWRPFRQFLLCRSLLRQQSLRRSLFLLYRQFP